MKITIIISSILIAGAIIGGVFLIINRDESLDNKTPNGSNVSIIDGKQIIEIRARGGYQPRISVAKANVPTVVRFVTSTTFDCSSFVRFPSMGIVKTLPPTGTTDVDIGSQNAKTLLGSCGMGMYPFQIDFKDSL